MDFRQIITCKKRKRNQKNTLKTIIMKLTPIILLLLCFIRVSGQADTAKTLSPSEMIQIVLSYHPIAKQADIHVQKSKAALLTARGAFDPELQAMSAEKIFGGVKYYNSFSPSITIPTWYGVELTAGMAFLEGDRANPSESAGQSSFLGISVPLAKNLLMDKRRAALKTASIYRDLSEVEKNAMLINLKLEAYSAYWKWVKSYEVFKIASEAVVVNEKRLSFVRSAFLLGERPAIDTTESWAQLQSMQYLQNDASMQLQNARIELSLYLWQPNNAPYTLQEDVIPQKGLLVQPVSSRPIPSLEDLLRQANLAHPKILSFTYKMKEAEINRQLKFQDLLPSLKLKYNQLGKGYNILKTAGAPWIENNYQLGFSLSMPLRLSEGRGGYRMAKLKLMETSLQQDYAKATVSNKIITIFNELLAFKKQVEIQSLAYQNYMLLQKGELLRFSNGESSLFFVNSRENKTLEVAQKLAELKCKYFETEMKLQWAAGL